MSPLELVDDRFEQLARELRAARPAASDNLHERVLALGTTEPTTQTRRRLPQVAWGRVAKRTAFALAAVAVAIPLAVAGVKSLHDSNAAKTVAPKRSALRQQAVVHGLPAGAPDKLQFRSAAAGPAVGVNPARLQQYGATLRLRVGDVDALSNATKRAMSITRELGGYVAGVGYSTRGGHRGGADLVLRVPIENVQTALVRFSALGTILDQHVALLDVQRRSDRQAKAIARLETDLVRIEALLKTSLPPATRAQLEQQASADRFALKTLQRRHAALLRRAHFTKIDLRLTIPASKAATPGRLDRTLDDAGSVLVRELEILLYALIVVGPLLALGGLAIGLGRVQRRRSDGRLLERS